MPRNNREAGFTLLEAIVALAVLTLALAMLYRGAASGLALSGDAADTQQAVARARSHLAVVGYAGPIVPGTTGGNDGSGFTWRQRIAEADSASRHLGSPDDPASGSEAVIKLYDVTVVVSWLRDGKPHAVELTTRRVEVNKGGV